MSRTAILIPSLNRPQLLRGLIDNIARTTNEPYYIYFTVSDSESIQILLRAGVMFDDDSWNTDQRYVTRMNSMAHNLRSNTEFMFFGSDDVEFKAGWLSAAIKVAIEQNKLVVVGDDMRNRSGTMALMSVAWKNHAVYDEPGNVFCSKYHHNFADTEQFDTAAEAGVFARAMDSKVEHLNPVFRHSRSIPRDATYDLSSRWWSEDANLYRQRHPLVLSYGELMKQRRLHGTHSEG